MTCQGLLDAKLAWFSEVMVDEGSRNVSNSDKSTTPGAFGQNQYNLRAAT